MSEEIKAELVPFYVVGDVSGSMMVEGSSGKSGIDALNDIVPTVVKALISHPVVADKIRFGLISFSDSATVEVPLSDLRDIANSTPPTLRPGGGTSYMSAFMSLRVTLENDVNQLKADGYRVHRPVVFFFSDGYPTDAEQDWKDAWAKLTEDTPDYRAYPILLPFGVGEATKESLEYIAFPQGGKYEVVKARVGGEEQDAAEVIARSMNVLVQSIVATAKSMAAGEKGAVVKGLAEGFEADDDDEWI